VGKGWTSVVRTVSYARSPPSIDAQPRALDGSCLISTGLLDYTPSRHPGAKIEVYRVHRPRSRRSVLLGRKMCISKFSAKTPFREYWRQECQSVPAEASLKHPTRGSKCLLFFDVFDAARGSARRSAGILLHSKGLREHGEHPRAGEPLGCLAKQPELDLALLLQHGVAQRLYGIW
jgi:hypothetical protein